MDIRIAQTENDIKAVYSLRFEVFVEEQNVPPEIELDGEDAHALHIMAEENGETVGCARLIIDGGEGHIGRLAVKKACRGSGVGTEICRFIIGHCRRLGCKRIWLNSQIQAVSFYERLGFMPVGERFFEAGIEHMEMEIKEQTEKNVR